MNTRSGVAEDATRDVVIVIKLGISRCQCSPVPKMYTFASMTITNAGYHSMAQAVMCWSVFHGSCPSG